VTPNDDSPVTSAGYSLSIALATKSVDLGDSDTVSGVLTKAGVPAAGDTVRLRAWTNHRHNRHHLVGTATTGADGSVSFTVTPRTDTHYRLVFRTADPTPDGARSKVATIHVLRETSLSIRAYETRRGEVIRGQLRGGGHALPGRRVVLQERAVGDATWTPVATHRTHRHGVVSFRITAPAVPEEFQLVYAGGPNYRGSQSGIVTIG
jgi:5-hydroxyisourate hydrolase-like protein (transthyretin family)